MFKRSFLPFGLATAAFLWCVGPGLLAQEGARLDRKRAITPATGTYTGRVLIVDEVRRTITLSVANDVGRIGKDDRPAADRIASVPPNTGGIPSAGTITKAPPGNPAARGTGAPGTEVNYRRPGADGPRPGTTSDTGAPGTEGGRRRPGADAPPAVGRPATSTASITRMFRVSDKARITFDGRETNFTALRMGEVVRVHVRPAATTSSSVRSAADLQSVDRIEILSAAPAPGSGAGRPGIGDRPGSTGRPGPGDDRPASTSRSGGL